MDRYADVHATRKGPGDARPTALQVVLDEIRARTAPLQDLVIVITGANSGLGFQTAKALAVTGARLFLTARSVAAGEEAARLIIANTETAASSKALEVVQLELDSLESVRKAAAEISSKTDKVNILINNAGIAVAPEGITKDGFERHWGVNYIGPFLFTHNLLPLLNKGGNPQFHSRIVNVSSTGHRLFPIHLEDPNNEQKRPYDPMSAYATSKLANVLHANYLDKMLSPKGVRAVSLHPGTVMETKLLRNVQNTPSHAEDVIPALTDGEVGEYKSAEQGAATIVFAAIAECLEDKGGLYLENCTVGKEAPVDLGPLDGGYSKEAFDDVAAETLWKSTCQQLKLQEDV